MKCHRWYLIAIIALAALLFQMGLRLRQQNSELERVYANEVVIKAIDADTKESVQIVFHGPGRGVNQRWPEYTIFITEDLSELRVRWTDVGPLHIGVSSAGYSEQPLILDRESEKRLVVPLRKAAIVEPIAAPDRGK